ncbi:hypothetical protein ACMFMG_004319 [Clarireedia jacksonii]
MENLAALISANTSTLTKQLRENGHPEPTMSNDSPIYFPDLGSKANTARAELIQAAEELILLANGPYDSFLHLRNKVVEMAALRALVNHRIPELIPLDGTVSFTELSTTIGVAEDVLERLIRYAICFGYLAEHTSGFVSHNALSSMMVRDTVVAAAIRHDINVHYPSTLRIFESTKVDPTGSKEDKCAFSIAFSEAEKPLASFWKYAEAHPDMLNEFHSLMSAATSSSFWSFQHITDGFEWSQIGHLVDVGGSAGHMSMSIADKYPLIRLDVQDLKEVIEISKTKVPEKYASRINFSSHDFFEVQPVVADAYLYRCVFHNWRDEDARKIIRNLIPALRTGSRLIIADHVIPELGEAPTSVTKAVRQLDILMFTMLATKERSKKDFVDLVTAADERLKLESFRSFPGSALSILVFQFTE